jgi:lysophospholipase
MQTAPYHSNIAFGSGSPQSFWRETKDGIRLRVALWPCEGAQHTVLLFTGRTEYVEKYGAVADALNAAGYAVASLDWRGQGLSDRLIEPRWRGHIESFDQYQTDVSALLATIDAAGLPKPKSVIAHSMGGAIALRSLHEGLAVKSAVFSAPMWGILMSPALRPAAWVLTRLADALGRGGALSPGTQNRTFIQASDFQGNKLTTDPEMWAQMAHQIVTAPDLELGGPSLHWVREAVTECATLAKRPSPTTPALTLLGSDEQIVDTQRIHDRMDRWTNGTLTLVPRAQHEVLMETKGMRSAAIEQISAFIAEH